LPILIEGLQSNLAHVAAEGLGEMGPDALAAADKLEALFVPRSATVHPEYAFALWQITGDPNDVLSRLKQLLNQTDPFNVLQVLPFPHRQRALTMLYKMGPAAAPLLPDILALIADPYSANGDKELAIRAVQRIDPPSTNRIAPGILKEFLPRIERHPLFE
jgi:hypothetical protein